LNSSDRSPDRTEKRPRHGPDSRSSDLYSALAGFFPLSSSLLLLLLILGLILQYTLPIPGMMRPLAYFPTLVLFVSVAVYAGLLIWARFRWRQRRQGGWIEGIAGWKEAWHQASHGPLSRPHRFRLLAASLFIPALLNTFGCWKLAIPRWQGFSREELVMNLSWGLNGGISGWSLLQPVLGHPWITWTMDRIYFTWLPVFVVMVLWQTVWREPTRERKRFILALTFVWLGLGAVLATLGASAGPIFLDRLMPSADPYTEMMAYLNRVDGSLGLITLEVRELLWQAKEGNLGDPLRGISAFPSIHVAMTTLYALALWRPNRRLAVAALAYTAAIGIATVHLGWHYTADVYAGILGAILCWFGAGLWAGSPGSTGKSLESVSGAP